MGLFGDVETKSSTSGRFDSTVFHRLDDCCFAGRTFVPRRPIVVLDVCLVSMIIIVRIGHFYSSQSSEINSGIRPTSFSQLLTCVYFVARSDKLHSTDCSI